jgi:hypothetical protein
MGIGPLHGTLVHEMWTAQWWGLGLSNIFSSSGTEGKNKMFFGFAFHLFGFSAVRLR